MVCLWLFTLCVCGCVLIRWESGASQGWRWPWLCCFHWRWWSLSHWSLYWPLGNQGWSEKVGDEMPVLSLWMATYCTLMQRHKHACINYSWIKKKKKKSPYVQLIVILWQNNQYYFPLYKFNISFNIVGMTCILFNRDIRHSLLPQKSTVDWGQMYCPVGLQLLKSSLLTTKNCARLVKDSEKCESLMFH